MILFAERSCKVRFFNQKKGDDRPSFEEGSTPSLDSGRNTLSRLTCTAAECRIIPLKHFFLRKFHAFASDLVLFLNLHRISLARDPCKVTRAIKATVQISLRCIRAFVI